MASTSVSGNVDNVVGALEGADTTSRRTDEPDTAPRHPNIEVRVGPTLRSLSLGTARYMKTLSSD